MGLTLSVNFEAQLRCCICLDVFTSPVSTPCGHNFCQACLQGYWDRCDRYSCPLCKTIFDEKPKLSINCSFSEITELFKESRQATCSKMELERTRADIQKFIQERWKKLEEIQKSVELSKINSRRVIEDSIQAFTTLVGSIVRSQIEFVEKVQEKQKAEETRADGFIKELEKEMTELQKRNVELEQLWHTEDLIHFLQDWTEATVHADVGVGTVRCVTSGLKRAFKETENFFSAAEFQRMQLHAVDVTLDPSTANPWLVLSEDGKQVWDGDTQLHLPDCPKRFDSSVCVLAKEGFTTGRHYWEVEVGEKVAWDIGVVRETVNRKGIISANPEDGYWTMCLRHSNMYSCCGTCCFSLPPNRRPRKLGVYLDYEEGQISFYNVDVQSHMYTHRHTFTERLYPFFSPYTNDDGPNTAPLVISPVRMAAQ
ncbi:nuclear factor 7, brain-like isoform X2 [Brienomyrus brachyistius]|uniref:nuclear factor 7, brain-like isoform X2 n=1 Tax=Brienomyrus brachyistius TaxID=42636 RepID=UPI0020B248C5|nr:nuclear factor 7, brain-like isoform X2 [Brienomyrus brachyistius]